MSVLTAANMVSASADGDVIPGTVRTEHMEINNTSGGAITVTLTKNNAGAVVLFKDEIPAASGKNYNLKLRVPKVGILVNMSGAGATVYLYSK